MTAQTICKRCRGTVDIVIQQDAQGHAVRTDICRSCTYRVVMVGSKRQRIRRSRRSPWTISARLRSVAARIASKSESADIIAACGVALLVWASVTLYLVFAR